MILTNQQIRIRPRGSNSTFTKLLPRSLPRVSQHTRRRFVNKRKFKIQPAHSRYLLLSSYQVYGAYAHVGGAGHASDSEVVAVAAATSKLYCDDPLRVSVAYNYVRELAREPPDNEFSRLLAFIGIVFIYSFVTAYVALRILRCKKKSPPLSTPTSTACHRVLTSSADLHS